MKAHTRVGEGDRSVMISPADVAKVIDAADKLEQHLTPAEAVGVMVMHRIDPAVLAQLQARLDNNAE